MTNENKVPFDELVETVVDGITVALENAAPGFSDPAKQDDLQKASDRIHRIIMAEKDGTANTKLPEIGTKVKFWPNQFGVATGSRPKHYEITAHWTSGDGTRSCAQITMYPKMGPMGSFYADQFWIDAKGKWHCQLL